MSDPTENEAHPAQPSESGESGDGGENAKAKNTAQSRAFPLLPWYEELCYGGIHFFVYALGIGFLGVIFKLMVLGLMILADKFNLVEFSENFLVALVFYIIFSAKPMLNPDWWWYVLVMAYVQWNCSKAPTAPSALRDNIFDCLVIFLGYGMGAMFFSWGMKTLFYSP